MSALLGTLEHFAAPWAKLYNDHRGVQTTVACVHVGAMLLAGGLAIATDRATLRAAKLRDDLRQHQLSELAAVHKPVMFGLALTVLSGLLLLGADVEHLLVSPVLWTKLGLFVVLLGNGLWIRRTESALMRAPEDRGWVQLRFAAVVSLVLWFAVALTGTALLNIS